MKKRKGDQPKKREKKDPNFNSAITIDQNV
jgi:hypothetical protein